MRAAILIGAVVLGTTVAPAPAEAQIEGDAAIVTTAVLGTLAGITNSIAVTVYAVDGRALGSGWVVSSLFSSAICGAIAVSFVVRTIEEGSHVGTTVGTLFYTFLAAWPGYYVVRSALSEAEPGEYFDAEVVPEETDDPIDALEAAPRWVPSMAGWSFTF